VIRATPEHPFRVESRGWIAAGELTVGKLLTKAGKIVLMPLPQQKIGGVDIPKTKVQDVARSRVD
jgi:hypothetical protein